MRSFFICGVGDAFLHADTDRTDDLFYSPIAPTLFCGGDDDEGGVGRIDVFTRGVHERVGDGVRKHVR